MHIRWWPRFLTMAAVNFPLLLRAAPAFPLLEEHPDPAQQLLKNKQVLGLASGSFKLCLSLCQMWTEVLSYRASWWGEEEG